jgi:hypothetical protein
MKAPLRYVLIFVAGVLAAVLVQKLIVSKRTSEAKTVAVLVDTGTQSTLVVTQIQVLDSEPAAEVVGNGFLFDELRPQDLERMEPPRTLPGLSVPPPKEIPPPPKDVPRPPR